MMNYFVDVIKKYAVFTGRARRREYWMFWLLFSVSWSLLGSVVGLVQAVFHGAKFGFMLLIYLMLMIVPFISLAVRRMHDIDRSGWWCFCPVFNLVALFIEGTRGDNRFGADPKADTVNDSKKSVAREVGIIVLVWFLILFVGSFLIGIKKGWDEAEHQHKMSEVR
jgi:uncharacterized membrane protein YhaH (DUF805 family)